VTAIGALLAVDTAAPPAPPRDVAHLFSALGPPVLGYVRGCGCRDPEDVVGEVFTRIAGALPRFDGDDRALRAWVFTIAYRCVIDDRRRSQRHGLLLRRVGHSAPVAAPDEPFDPALLAALGHLTAEQREVVTLRFIADLPLDEVSRITGKPVGAVKALQHRGLLALRALLQASSAQRRERAAHC
jgi:RNA polymerase sigma-70 factor, ECF subfamily